MTSHFTKIALALVAVVGFATQTARAEDKSETFKVSGMTCASCENSVKKAVTKLDGVNKVEADSEKGQAVVSYDPAKVTPEKITAAINTTPFKVAK